MIDPKFLTMARVAAVAADLDPVVVAAVCENESSWSPNAIRFESRFYEHYERALHLEETDKLQRACSYGLMQVMGQVARELGFTGTFRELYDPGTNLYYGCRKLGRAMADHDHDLDQGLLAYNGGADHNYAVRVRRRMEHYTIDTGGELGESGA